MARYARIASTGGFLPEREVTNDELRARFGDRARVVDKLERSTGILSRRYAPDDWTTSDLALPAAREALAKAGRKPEEVDLIVLGTDSPDFVTPATSAAVQQKLGAVHAGTFDVNCACASFTTGLACAAGWIATNADIRTVLVLGVYLMHRFVAVDDPTVFLFGDGSGAAVLEPAAEPGFLAAAAEADGSYYPNWGIFAGAAAEPATAEAVAAGRTNLRMLERYPTDLNVLGWPRLIRRLAKSGGFDLGEIDLVLFTQMNRSSIERALEALEIPVERTHLIMERSGYTGSACIPMALDDAWRAGRVQPGNLVVMVGSGVGYNQAGVAFRMT
jgi:3-oxoacyl-[acyl-carrier-protein] synthase III